MGEHALTWGETPTEDDKLWGLLAHLSPFVSAFIGPIIVLVLYQEKSKFVKYHAWQAIAWQAVLWISGVLVTIISTITCGIGSLLYLPWLLLLLGPLYGAYLAWNGKWDGFPMLTSFGK